MSMAPARRICVCGGGASGIFSSIFAAASSSDNPRSKNQVTVLEASSKTLTKVHISGGGRCNVLHDTSKAVPDILDGYPRGKKELTGLLSSKFPPTRMQEWLATRQVTLKTEDDGRMFPVTDSSDTIVQALLGAAVEAGVDVRTRCKVESVEKMPDGSFEVTYTAKKGRNPSTSSREIFDAVILATGSAPVGYRLAQSLGHSLVPPVPSLFTLSTKHEVKDEKGLFHELAGLSVPHARLSFKFPSPTKKAKYLHQEGPLLITHHGLSGPAALKLSAFGARALHDCNYRGELILHWAPHLGRTDEVFEQLWKLTQTSRKTISTVCPFTLPSSTKPAQPRRLWARMVQSVGLDKKTWAEAPKKLIRKLAMQICECRIEMTGKGTFKEEFVTAGGVSLKEVDMRTMQSKKQAGLFLCGELLDVDGITGGYNFMNCWASGYTAGSSAAVYDRQPMAVDDASSSATPMVVVFGRPGSGKTTVSDAMLDALSSKDVLGLDLDVCVPQWMKNNFAAGIYPTLEQRRAFALDCCDYVDRRIRETSPSICVITFSFVNTDLRETFRERFPAATWCLMDTSEDEAERRIQLRQGHFYTGKKGNANSDERDDSVTPVEDNSVWDFAPVDFDHVLLDGHASVTDNAHRVTNLVKKLL